MALLSVKKSQLSLLCPQITLGEQLGEGGNARVFAGESKAHGPVAVKFMLNDNTKRYSRFRDEVTVVTTRLNGSSRVVPIIESYLPPKLGDGTIPWYVMPRATRLMSHVHGKSWRGRLQAMLDLGRVSPRFMSERSRTVTSSLTTFSSLMEHSASPTLASRPFPSGQESQICMSRWGLLTTWRRRCSRRLRPLTPTRQMSIASPRRCGSC